MQTHFAQQYWGHNTQSSFTNEAVDVETDATGNVYLTGYYSGSSSLQAGGPQIYSQGNTDIYVSKYNATGSLIWTKNFGGNFSDKPSDLTVDNIGNVLITGQYFGQISFGTTVLNSNNGSKDMFILKLDNTGNVVWAISEGGSGSENAFGIAVDALNNVIVTGQFKGSSSIAGQPLTSMIDPTSGTANYDLFVAKYTPLGVPVWLKTGVAKYEERGLALDVDNQNNIFITGQFSDTLTLAGTQFNNNATHVGLIAKFNSAGVLQWMNTLKAGSVVPYDIELNSSSEPVVIGDFSGTMQYVNGTISNTISAIASKKIFALKIANSGTFVWSSTFSSENDLSARALAIDASKNVFITGYFKCGWTELQTNSLPQATFNSVGYKDAYLIGLSNSGTTLYVKTFGGTQNDEGSGIAIDDLQNPLVCGSYTSDLHIPVNPTLLTDYQVSTTSYNLNSVNNSPIHQSYVLLNGDLSPNSFVTNSVHALTPEYNYFNLAPTDSLDGVLYPNLDTIHFCYGADIQYIANTLYGSGPEYDYAWSNGGTDSITYINQTGVYTLNVQRADGCVSHTESIVGILDPSPSLPLMFDDQGISNGTSSYPSFALCQPDTVNIWFTNLCSGCTINISPNGVNDTLSHGYTLQAPYSVSVSNGLCETSGEFWIISDSVKPFDSIQPYLYFIEDTDQNDTINICYGDTLNVHFYDSINNPPLPILGQFHDEPIDYYYSSSPNSMLPITGISSDPFVYTYRPDTSGWYVFEYLQILGYDNSCGSNTIQYLITDSVYISMPPSLSVNISITATDSLCPSSSTVLTANPSFSNFTWSGPGLASVSNGNDSAQVNQAGIYHYAGSLTYTATGCISDFDIEFEVVEKQSPTILTNPSDGVLCPGDSIVLSVSNIYTSYSWLDPDGNSPSNTNALTAGDVGFYYVDVVDSSGCTLTSTGAEITQYASPGIYADPQNAICGNESLTINVSYVGAPAINWINPSSAGNASQITVNQPGVYICEMQQCGLTTTDSVLIIDGSFSISLSATSSVLCYGDSSIISTDPGYNSYIWNNNASIGHSVVANTLGNYSVIAVNQYGCGAYSDTITVTSALFSYPPNIPDSTI